MLANWSSGADFDDAEYGVKEEDKDPRKVNLQGFVLIYHADTLSAGG